MTQKVGCLVSIRKGYKKWPRIIFLNVTRASIKLALVAQLVEVQVDRLAVVLSFLRDWADNDLSWTEPERPLAAKMLDQNGHEALHRT